MQYLNINYGLCIENKNPHFLIYNYGTNILLSPLPLSPEFYTVSQTITSNSRVFTISTAIIPTGYDYILEYDAMDKLMKLIWSKCRYNFQEILDIVIPPKPCYGISGVPVLINNVPVVITECNLIGHDPNKVRIIHDLKLVPYYYRNVIKFRSLETIETNPGPGYKILIRCSNVNAFLIRNDDDTFSLTDKIQVDFVISDKEPADFIGDTDVLNELIFKLQQEDKIKANDIVRLFKPRIESSFVVGVLVQKKNAKFFVDAEHHVSARGIEKDINLKLLYLLYPN